MIQLFNQLCEVQVDDLSVMREKYKTFKPKKLTQNLYRQNYSIESCGYILNKLWHLWLKHVYEMAPAAQLFAESQTRRDLEEIC